MIQYPRAFSCTIGTLDGSDALEFSQFRCQFQIDRGDTETPNTCDVRIFNLAPDTANRVQNEFSQIVIKAGYQPLDGSTGNLAQIFKGVLKQVRIGRLDAKDTYIDVTGADGDEAYNFSVMSLSLAAGPSALPANFLQAILSSMTAVTAGPTPTFSSNASLRGRVFFGMSRDEMRDWARTNNCTWSIQDGQITVIPNAFPIPSTPVVISPQTGLIGVPEQTQNGISVRTLLNPAFRIGTLVRLDSNINKYRFGVDYQSQGVDNNQIFQEIQLNPDGLYYVMSASHSGDTRGQPWYSDLICLSVDATFVGSNQFTAVPASLVGSIKPF